MANPGTSPTEGRIEPVIGALAAADASVDLNRAQVKPVSSLRWLVPALLVLGAGAAGLAYWYTLPGQEKPAPVAAAPAPAVLEKVEPAIRHPIEAAAVADAPLPALATSDVVVFDALAGLLGRDPAGRFLVLPDIIRRVVVAVDNLPRERLAQRLSPVRPVPGAFAVAGSAGRQEIDAGNAARYSPYVRALDAVDAARLVAVYVRFYPLFQQAYRDLGYPKGYFNDRLVEALDLIIAAPEPAGPIALVQEKVMYEFADPKLEALPVGQKMLLRMGPENARKVKAKLGEVRALVADRK